MLSRCDDFEVPYFYAIYSYKFFKNKSVFLIVGDMVRCIELDFLSKQNSIFKCLINYIYWSFDKRFLSKYSNQEIAFGGNYRGWFKQKHLDQYSKVNSNHELYMPSYSLKDFKMLKNCL